MCLNLCGSYPVRSVVGCFGYPMQAVSFLHSVPVVKLCCVDFGDATPPSFQVPGLSKAGLVPYGLCV
jgi:hypothetical protein